MITAQRRLVAGDLLERGRRGIDSYGWRALTKELIMRSARPAMGPVAGRHLQQRAARTRGVDDVLDLAFTFNAFGITIRPSQSRWEFRQLLTEVARLKPRAMLEIGTANGGTLFAFTRVCASDAHVISVDLPHGAFGGGYPRWRIPLYKSFAAPSQHLDLIRADSHSPQTFADVKARLNGRSLDFLFIDGDHTYDGVQTDFARYRSLIRPGGLIAFHDIAPRRDYAPDVDDGGDVPRFWAELSARHGGHEFVDPDGHGCFGIGLIQV